MKKVLFSLFVLAGFAACTSDDVVISESTGITSDTAEAYLTVRISDAGSSTRATSQGYTDATPAEYDVSNAYFYFYDENGEFVSRAEVWDGMTETTEQNANVQFTSSTVVVLKGLTQRGYPRYMVTVLNRPSDFEDYNAAFDEPAGTLAELETKLAEADYDSRSTTTTDAYNSTWSYEVNAGIWDADNNFVMSTTSFLNEEISEGVWAGNVRAGQTPYYFVTELQDSDFYDEPVGNENAQAVDVYVERLAAKVTMAVNDPIIGADGTEMPYVTWTDEDDTITGYVFTTTIAGDANMNDGDAGAGAGNDYDVDAGIEEGVEDIYIVLEGWALNAKARESYIVKNLDTAWADGTAEAVAWTSDGTGNGSTVAWQSTSENRSFWGKSFNYGITHIYPTSSDNGYGAYTGDQVGNYDADELSKDTWLDDYVMYTSLNADQLKAFTTAEGAEDPEYCAENTNTVAVLGARTSSAITSALVKARAYMATTDQATGDKTYAPVTLIRYKGELFTEAAYEQKIEQDVIEKTQITIDGGTYTLSQIYIAPAGVTAGVGGIDVSILEAYGSASAAGTAEEINSTYNEYFNTDGSYTETDYTATWSAATDKNDFYWEQIGQGQIKIEFGGNIDATTQWVWIETTNENGETAYFHAETEDIAETINDAIYTAVGSFNDGESYAFNEGLMYYNVPIEHLNNSVSNNANGTQATGNFAEGQYGVVRNHSYVLTIGGINELGHPISDENEVIIPDNTEQVYLYVEAQINILAWKDVQQGVTLK